MNELTTLAQAIRAEDQACHMAASNALSNAIKAGEYLTAAKKMIPHGGWEKWLDSKNPVDSIRTAQVYVQLFHNRQAIEEAQRAAPLSIREAFKLIVNDRDQQLAEATVAIRRCLAEARRESRFPHGLVL